MSIFMSLSLLEEKVHWEHWYLVLGCFDLTWSLIDDLRLDENSHSHIEISYRCSAPRCCVSFFGGLSGLEPIWFRNCKARRELKKSVFKMFCLRGNLKKQPSHKININFCCIQSTEWEVVGDWAQSKHWIVLQGLPTNTIAKIETIPSENWKHYDFWGSTEKHANNQVV